jgi:hypothetical protein
MAILVIRDDSINYGTSGAAAAIHKLMTVMVKLK